MKKDKLLFIILIVFIIILLFIITLQLCKKEVIQQIRDNIFKSVEDDISISYSTYNAVSKTEIKVIITIDSIEKIEYIKCPNDLIIYSNEKNKIVFDYTLSENVDTTFRVKVHNNENEIIKTVRATIPITSITLNKGFDFLQIGSSGTITAQITPNIATNQTLTWQSNHPEIASVNSNGLVTGIAEGNATITATTTDGTNKSASCSVSVYSNITAADLGKFVNGYVASGATSLQWRLFFFDKDYVYIISNTIAQTIRMASENPYGQSIYYTTTKPTNAIWSKYCTLWNQNWSSSDKRHTEGSYLLTESNWTKYKDAAGKAEFAVAGPPFEMYIQSLNAAQNLGYTYSWDGGYRTSGTSALNSYNNGIYMLSRNLNNFSNYPIVVGPYPTSYNYFWVACGANQRIEYGNHTNVHGLRPIVAIPKSVFNYNLT